MRAFVSYSHNDERYLDRLKVHLSNLTREGLLESWTDREIHPGSAIDSEVEENLRQADIFMALLSPDYIASRYCIEIEMPIAMQLATEGSMRVIPIVVEPCEWKKTPYGKLLALPKEGKPISEWTNANLAYLDIVTQIRRIMEQKARYAPSTSSTAPNSKASLSPLKSKAIQYRAKRNFSSVEKAEFLRRGFEEIRTFIKNSTEELQSLGHPYGGYFEILSDSRFRCIVSNKEMRNGDAHLCVWKNGQGIFDEGIFVSTSPVDMGNGYNRCYGVQADGYDLYLKNQFDFGNEAQPNLSAREAAETLWEETIKRAGISILGRVDGLV